jgi:hypothetical protein
LRFSVLARKKNYEETRRQKVQLTNCVFVS